MITYNIIKYNTQAGLIHRKIYFPYFFDFFVFIYCVYFRYISFYFQYFNAMVEKFFLFSGVIPLLFHTIRDKL